MSTEGAESVAALQREVADLRGRVAHLEREARRFEALWSVMSEIVIIIDADGRYLDVAPTLPFPPEAIQRTLRQTVRDTFRPAVADEILASIRRSLATGEQGSLEYPLDLPHGEVWHSGVFRPVSDIAVIWYSRDVTPERRLRQAERTEIELREQVIAAQRAALRELSTPLIPLAAGVIALPLVGTLDSVRAQEVMETLLEGIVERQARTALLDVTGVRMIDTHVANALIRVARAAGLLGAQVILTGIRPEVAQTLVHLQADLSGIVTLGDLQSGIAHALRGESV